MLFCQHKTVVIDDTLVKSSLRFMWYNGDYFVNGYSYCKAAMAAMAAVHCFYVHSHSGALLWGKPFFFDN